MSDGTRHLFPSDRGSTVRGLPNTPSIILIFWIGNEQERVLAEMLRKNCLAYISGMGPLLLRHVLCMLLVTPTDTQTYELL